MWHGGTDTQPVTPDLFRGPLILRTDLSMLHGGSRNARRYAPLVRDDSLSKLNFRTFISYAGGVMATARANRGM